jgi:hypothetical protein
MRVDDIDHVRNSLRDYFQLDVCLEKLYSEWSQKDSHFAKKMSHLWGTFYISLSLSLSTTIFVNMYNVDEIEEIVQELTAASLFFTYLSLSLSLQLSLSTCITLMK